MNQPLPQPQPQPQPQAQPQAKAEPQAQPQAKAEPQAQPQKLLVAPKETYMRVAMDNCILSFPSLIETTTGAVRSCGTPWNPDNRQWNASFIVDANGSEYARVYSLLDAHVQTVAGISLADIDPKANFLFRGVEHPHDDNITAVSFKTKKLEKQMNHKTKQTMFNSPPQLFDKKEALSERDTSRIQELFYAGAIVQGVFTVRVFLYENRVSLSGYLDAVIFIEDGTPISGNRVSQDEIEKLLQK